MVLPDSALFLVKAGLFGFELSPREDLSVGHGLNWLPKVFRKVSALVQSELRCLPAPRVTPTTGGLCCPESCPAQALRQGPAGNSVKTCVRRIAPLPALAILATATSPRLSKPPAPPPHAGQQERLPGRKAGYRGAHLTWFPFSARSWLSTACGPRPDSSCHVVCPVILFLAAPCQSLSPGQSWKFAPKLSECPDGVLLGRV